MVGHSFTLDLVIGFQLQEDAEQVMKVLGKRLAKYGLALQSEKTRLISFGRPPRTHKGKSPGVFDLLGFRWYWRQARSEVTPVWWTSRYLGRRRMSTCQRPMPRTRLSSADRWSSW
jgi:hypothetical protein